MTTGQKTSKSFPVIQVTLSIITTTALAYTISIHLPQLPNEPVFVSPIIKERVLFQDAPKNITDREDNIQVFECSAYCSCELCCGIWATLGVNAAGKRVTASQHVIRPGDKFVAADSRFAFGTLLTIPGYNNGRPVPVLDRGGAIKGNKLDVYFPTHERALQWGRQYLTVSIEETK